MLGLILPTDPRWVGIVERNIGEILTDHAWCEQKAASNAISVVVRFPEHPELVRTMLAVAAEELQHFRQVHDLLTGRGYALGPERRDEYVNLLYAFRRKGVSREAQLTDHLLFAALVEARSCERFRLLSEGLADEELRAFYRDLMKSEAGHYAVFLGFARRLGGEAAANRRWDEFLRYEAEVITRFGKKETMHG
jgi:tRNA-(ms[2]io[6]A)-hydroxylase